MFFSKAKAQQTMRHFFFKRFIRRRQEVPQSFIVLASARSGSNYLQTLLNSHSRIVCLGEILVHGIRTDMLTEKTELLLKDRWMRKIILRKPQFPKKHSLSFLKTYFAKHFPGISRNGLRIFYEHTQGSPYTPLWRYLERKKDLKIIHLIRRNHLRRCLSLAVARSSGIWVAKEKKNIPGQVFLDFNECLDFIEKSDKYIRLFRQFLRERQVLEIYYEELIQNTEQELCRILDYLNLERQYLSSPLEKINTALLSEKIKNYWDLKNRFKNTKWLHLFEE